MNRDDAAQTATNGPGSGLRRRQGWRWLALFALFAGGPLHAQDTLRCGNRLVEVGDIAAKVRAVCGPPTYVDVWTYAVPRPLRYVADAEEWTYNFGPNRLLQILRFRDGRLQRIRSDGYGFSPPPDHHCNPDDIYVGMSKYRLLAQCGAPISRRAEELLAPTVPNGYIQRLPDGVYAYQGGYARDVYREHWVYNFGPSYLLREVTLENGRVTDVENGDRGFNPH